MFTYFVKGSLGSFFIQVVSIGLTLLNNFALVKMTTPAVYGAYTYIFTAISFIAGLSIIGFDSLLVKVIAEYKYGNMPGKIKGATTFVFSVTVGCSFIAAFICLGLSHTGIIDPQQSTTSLFILALTALPLLTLINMNQAALQGLQKIMMGQLAEKIIRPLILMALAAGFYFTWHQVLTLHTLVWLNIIAITVACIVSLALHRQAVHRLIKKVQPVFEIRKWLGMGLSFSLLNIIYLVSVRADILLVGLFKGNYEVGIFNIASKLPELINFPLVIVNFVLSPVISGLYANGKIQQLQKLITQSARIAAIMGFSAALLLILFRRYILSFFGADFLQAETALIILCIAQMVNILCGSVGTILTMTGHQRYAIISLVSGTVINVLLDCLLIPAYGINGAAVAGMAGIITWNILMYIFVRKKVNIHPTAFSII